MSNLSVAHVTLLAKSSVLFDFGQQPMSTVRLADVKGYDVDGNFLRVKEASEVTV